GVSTGRGRSSSALRPLKMDVLAPMPIANVAIATAVNPGAFASMRIANRRSFSIMALSFCSQRDDRIDARGATGWHAAGDQRDRQKRKHGDQHSPGVDGADVVKQRH